MNANEMIALAEKIAADPMSVDFSSGGSYRRVFVQDQYAFKFARLNGAIRMNQTEWFLYSIMPEEYREMFAKPAYISRNGSVIVMERLFFPKDGPTWDGFYYQTARADQAIREAFGNALFGDLHSGNFGYRGSNESETICLDYAWTHLNEDKDDISWQIRLMDAMKEAVEI